jgi:hypothetical protein
MQFLTLTRRQTDSFREQLNTLPLFQAGMLDVSIIPLKPYAGFSAQRAPEEVSTRRASRA